jgi:hypothetical protein
MYTFRTICLFLLLFFSLSALSQEEIVELKFRQVSDSGSAKARTLESLIRVRKISEQYATGGLYLMTHYGDREQLFEKENQKAIDHPMIDEPWRYCSVFSAKNGDSIIVGRNWDNQNVGSIIVSLYRPSSGYVSISFSRAIDMGFPMNVDLEDMRSTPLGSRLLLAPFYACDGMNERGLCATVTGISQVHVEPVKGKEFVFVMFLVRKILDQAKSVDEAVRLVEKYVPFDLEKNSLNCHFFVADSSGRSVVLEYRDDGWKRTYSEKPWQVMTNKVVYGVPDAKLREACWRYKTMFETFEKTNARIDWQGGLQALKNVSQEGTTWSVIYSPTLKDVHFSVYQSWEKVFHLREF